MFGELSGSKATLRFVISIVFFDFSHIDWWNATRLYIYSVTCGVKSMTTESLPPANSRCTTIFNMNFRQKKTSNQICFLFDNVENQYGLFLFKLSIQIHTLKCQANRNYLSEYYTKRVACKVLHRHDKSMMF